MKKEILYISAFLIILLIVFFIIRSFKITDGKIAEIAEKEVSSTLYDPYTAKFSNITVSKMSDESGAKTYRVCGFVNSKNLYGAYTGNKQFYILILSSGSSLSSLNKPVIEDSQTYGGIVNTLCNK
ncbi:hypothetical protein LHV16_02215 [Providencia rettgeri]|uniref:hypothetical protein n=1 Tax=Providencia rettgeri TaxID=587 RepID=UPI001B35E546|nr:hypothetical protein [Providencia rettgeri]EJD6367335.1 hypothetical protein [Providencia rettgeri]EJD6372298.1 hypothetical protein [Providencia rettgeri]ELR5031494.1 hypothetical protein [Providencia rettgeri]ELR5161012.1 hypothetical protein [Providencia rettgeri]ELR5250133.1 hypothetical protein [Providencia rettgeri]